MSCWFLVQLNKFIKSFQQEDWDVMSGWLGVSVSSLARATGSSHHWPLRKDGLHMWGCVKTANTKFEHVGESTSELAAISYLDLFGIQTTRVKIEIFCPVRSNPWRFVPHAPHGLSPSARPRSRQRRSRGGWPRGSRPRRPRPRGGRGRRGGWCGGWKDLEPKDPRMWGDWTIWRFIAVSHGVFRSLLGVSQELDGFFDKAFWNGWFRVFPRFRKPPYMEAHGHLGIPHIVPIYLFIYLYIYIYIHIYIYSFIYIYIHIYIYIYMYVCMYVPMTYKLHIIITITIIVEWITLWLYLLWKNGPFYRWFMRI